MVGAPSKALLPNDFGKDSSQNVQLPGLHAWAKRCFVQSRQCHSDMITARHASYAPYACQP